MNIRFGNFEISSDEYGIHLIVDNVTHLASGDELNGPLHTLISPADALKASVALAAVAQFAHAKTDAPAPTGSTRAAIDAALAAARANTKSRSA